MSVFYLVANFIGEADDKYGWGNISIAIVQYLWMVVILGKSCLYQLVCALIVFQDKVGVTGVLIRRDEHFANERRIIKTYLIVLALVGLFVATQIACFFTFLIKGKRDPDMIKLYLTALNED